MTAAGASDTYSGLLTAIPFAFRQSDSTVFRVYLVSCSLVGLVVTLIFWLGTLVVLDSMAGATAGVITFTPALYLLLWLAIVVPLVAPLLLVARRHRLHGASRRYDTWMGIAGFGFILLGYCGAIIAMPAAQRPPIHPGVFAGVLRQFYQWPAIAGIVPPLLGVAGLVGVHRLLQNDRRTLE